MNNKSKSEEVDVMENTINEVIKVMNNFGWLGVDKKVLSLNQSAMRFFKGVLRQQGKTESEIQSIQQYIDQNTNG